MWKFQAPYDFLEISPAIFNAVVWYKKVTANHP